MRALREAILFLVLATGALAAVAQSVPPGGIAAAKLEKAMIIGAWRLVAIDYSGPNGALADPVFGPDPHGVIIYDPSGWMSVQIATANRPAMSKPTARTSRVMTADDAKLAAMAFDTYYAYFGTWDYDAERSTITHHLNSSLLPYETGLDYRREIAFDGQYLKLKARSQEAGEERLRTLIWTKLSGSGLVMPPTVRSESTSPAPVRAASKYGDMPIDYKEAIRQYYAEHLRYPGSAQYQEITQPAQGYITAVSGAILMHETREYGWTVNVTLSAKDSHDSYTGFKTYTFLFRGEKIVDARLPLPGDEMSWANAEVKH